MSTWLGDAGFQQNLLAGSIFFVLELTLVIWLLPIFIQRHLDRSWAPSRKRMWRSAELAIASIPQNVRRMTRNPDDYKPGDFVSLMDRARTRLLEVMQTYAPALDPGLVDQWNTLLDAFERFYVQVRFFEMPKVLSQDTAQKRLALVQSFRDLQQTAGSKELLAAPGDENAASLTPAQKLDEALTRLQRIILHETTVASGSRQ